MATVRFSIPMIAEIDDNYPTFVMASKVLTDEQLSRMLTASVVATPEFYEFLATANDGATWCVANLDTDSLV